MSSLFDRANEMTRVTVTVAEGKGDSLGSTKIWLTTIALPRSEARTIREDLERLFLEDIERVPAHFIDAHEGRYSWGADGGPFYEISIFLAQSTVDGLIAATTLKLFASLQARFQRAGESARNFADDFGNFREMDRDEAISFARWMIWSRYSKLLRNTYASANIDFPDESDSLELVSESYNISSESWDVVVKDSFGAKYRVEFLITDGLPLAQTIERQEPS
ncbi:hypothetical protein FDA94_24710 [Herbidospora galbida]|uniref:Uncharacterized protein n=1 Tax=Herbidospora galbida TaxID=2575442 RepID=A0A4U3M971_9ACTN|nr:hypothetical protein [Herbidospora galbida]TKK85598.1 hypothetical protein FDA94_24710 [Herbidospora galbida]